MKNRKNIRDLFKFNDLISDLYNDRFDIKNLETNSENSNDIFLNYQVEEPNLINKIINFSDWYYIGFMTCGILDFDTNITLQGYTNNLQTVYNMLPSINIGSITPTPLFDIAIGTLPTISNLNNVNLLTLYGVPNEYIENKNILLQINNNDYILSPTKDWFNNDSYSTIIFENILEENNIYNIKFKFINYIPPLTSEILHRLDVILCINDIYTTSKENIISGITNYINNLIDNPDENDIDIHQDYCTNDILSINTEIYYQYLDNYYNIPDRWIILRSDVYNLVYKSYHIVNSIITEIEIINTSNSQNDIPLENYNIAFTLTTTSNNSEWTPNKITKTGTPLRWIISGSTNYNFNYDIISNYPIFDFGENENNEEIFITAYILEDINNITSIQLLELDITNINVDLCLNLISLYCQNNKLETLNINNNINLCNLNCSNNLLTSLNIDNNIKLTYFLCSNNQISNLNIDNNTRLVNFNCSSNLLTTLNVDNNINLILFYCSYNQLTILNINNNIKIRQLICNVNNLTEYTIDNILNNLINNLITDGILNLPNNAIADQEKIAILENRNWNIS